MPKARWDLSGKEYSPCLSDGQFWKTIILGENMEKWGYFKQTDRSIFGFFYSLLSQEEWDVLVTNMPKNQL